MIDCISVENMRLSDAYTIANLVPSLELMYRAAYGVFKAADWHGRIAIVVGSGNNGGDGFDYSNVKFVVLNTNHDNTWDAQTSFLREESAEAKAAGQWLVVVFHHSLYPGAGHITDDRIVSARKFWVPLLSELGVDVVLQGHDHVYARGFVTTQGRSAKLTMEQGGYPVGSGAPLYLTGGTVGACKWYEADEYAVQEGDPIVPGYGFLDINSAVPAQNPWGTNSGETWEQTYTMISVDADEMSFQVYMLCYDGESDRMVKEPYLYDSLSLRRAA